jgi:hypothetical protein
MIFGGYNILLYNYNSVLENADNYFKQISDLMVSNDEIIKFEININKNKIFFTNNGLIGEIRKIYTLTKGGKHTDHLMVYYK